MSIRIGFEKLKIKIPQHLYCGIMNLIYVSDLERIRTSNPQSRNLIFYPVELRSHFQVCKNTKLYIIPHSKPNHLALPFHLLLALSI